MNKEILTLENILRMYLNNEIELDGDFEREVVEKEHYEFISDDKKREAVKNGLTIVDAYNFFIDYSIKCNNKQVTITNKQYKLASFKKFLKNPEKYGFHYDINYYHHAYEITEGIINDFLSTRYRVSSEPVGSYYSIIRAMFNYLEKDRLILNNPVKYISLRKNKRKKLDVLTSSEIIELVKSFSPKTKLGLRNLLFVMIILDTGLLVSEIVKIKKEDIMNQSFRLRTSSSIRELDISVRTRELIDEYTQGTDNEIYLFENVNGGKYDPRTITRMLSSKSTSLGYDCRPTILRDTFASNYLQATRDFSGLAYILDSTIDNVKFRYSSTSSTYQRIGDLVWQ